MITATDPELAELIAAALAYAARGWYVIPLHPDSKRPAVPDHPEHACTGADPRCRRAGRHQGWQDRATTDPDRIIRAWTAGPRYGIGIACGPSRLLVLDLDMPKAVTGSDASGLDVLHALCDQTGQTLPDTYTVTTPTGGRHLYFHTEHELGNTAGTLGPLIDTRGQGGQVVAPPTQLSTGRYTLTHPAPVAVLPDWLATRLQPPPPSTPGPVALRAGARAGAYARAAVAAETRRVVEAGEGRRNHTLLLAAIALGQLVAGGALAEDDVRQVLTEAAAGHVAAGAYSAHQAQQTITSGLHRGATRPRPLPDTAA
jgi:hypothetical protein